jgi:hypothetical protein
MPLIFKNDARSLAWRITMWFSFKIYWHASKRSSISFLNWQCPSDGDFSFPRFVGLLIISLWLHQTILFRMVVKSLCETNLIRRRKMFKNYIILLQTWQRLQYSSYLNNFGKTWTSWKNIWDALATPSGIKREWYVYNM